MIGVNGHTLKFEDTFWKKTSKIHPAWVYRKIAIEIESGKIVCSKPDSDDDQKSFWIVTGCVLEEIADYYKGRTNVFRITWPTGHDLILSTNTDVQYEEWRNHFLLLVNPPTEIKQQRDEIHGSEMQQV